MATHSSILAWEIPSRPQSTALQSDTTEHTYIHTHKIVIVAHAYVVPDSEKVTDQDVMSFNSLTGLSLSISLV